MFQLLVTGCVSILGQVVLLRELNVAFYGVELIYIVAMSALMLWNAAGSAASRRKTEPSAAGVRALFLLVAAVLPLCAVLVRGLRPLLSAVPGSYLSLPLQGAAVLAVLLLPGAALGQLFQWTARIAMATGTSAARAYAAESLGGMIGGAAATLLFQLGVSNSRLAFGASLVCIAATRPGVVKGITAAPLLAAIVAAPWIDRATAGWAQTWDVLECTDTPQGRLTVTGREGMVSVFENDALWIESQGTDAEELVHCSAANVPELRSALIVGGASDGTLRELLKHSPVAVHVLELNSRLPALLFPFLDPDVRDAFGAPGVRIVHEDARQFLASGGAPYDLILVGMGEPSSGQVNRFYTREFFELCSGRLSSRGVVAFRLRASENVWSPQLTARSASILKAMRSTLGDVVVLPGTATIFIGSPGVLSRDPAPVSARLQERGVRARLVSPRYVDYLYRNPRFAEVASILEGSRSASNSDDRPSCYRYSLLLWLSRLAPDVADWSSGDSSGRAARGVPGVLLAAVGVVGLAAARRYPRLRAALLVGVAGAAGMTLETTILLRYQVVHGALFRDLGILVTGFMAGLSAGAWAVDRPGGRLRRTGYAIVGLFAVAAAGPAAAMDSGWDAGIGGSIAALFVAAALVSAVFGWTSANLTGEPRKEIGLLYGADLAGGCVAALATGLVLIPWAGLSATASLAAPVLLLALLLV